jgi:hypothetical protein
MKELNFNVPDYKALDKQMWIDAVKGATESVDRMNKSIDQLDKGVDEWYQRTMTRQQIKNAKHRREYNAKYGKKNTPSKPSKGKITYRSRKQKKHGVRSLLGLGAVAYGAYKVGSSGATSKGGNTYTGAQTPLRGGYRAK